MKRFILILGVVLGGCVTAPTTPEVVQQKAMTPFDEGFTFDEQCYGFAKQMKAIALLRDAGVDPAKVPSLIKPLPNIPLQLIVKEVYSYPTVTPDEGAKNSYETCTKRTFPVMQKALNDATKPAPRPTTRKTK